MPNPSHTVRRLAAGLARLSVDERRQLLEQFADELSMQHNNQNNQFAVALGGAELNWRSDLEALSAKLDALAAAVTSNRAESDRQFAAVANSLSALQSRPPCMHADLARAQLAVRECGAADGDA